MANSPIGLPSSSFAGSTGQHAGSVPVTPISNIRNRASNINPTSSHMEGEFASGVDASPTSTFSESATGTYRLNDPSLSALRATMQSGTPGSRKVMIRSDTSLSTCFDPTADRELYDLWAPKK